MCPSLLVAALAVAAPVPKAPPAPAPKVSASFALGTGVVAENPKTGTKAVRFSSTLDSGPVASELPGLPGAGKPTTRTFNYQLANVTVTTSDGTELKGAELEKKLADAVPMVRSFTPFDPEWRKLFADDVLFLEVSTRPGGVGNPWNGPGLNPGGGVRLRPVDPGIGPVPK